MNIWQRRIALAVTTASTIVLIYAALYQWGMASFEHEAVPFAQAVQVVVESLTTAGFGGHAPWSSRTMNLFVLTMNLTGVLLFFLAVPLFVVPLLREALKPHPPTEVELSDHVIICKYTPRGDAFIDELRARDRDYVVIEPDRARATMLYEGGGRVVVGDPESIEVLKRAGISTASAVAADAADDTNASIVLSVREANPEVRVVTLVEDPMLAEYHRLAGADEVLSPRQLVGASLARQVPTVMKTVIAEDVEIGNDIELVELEIESDSDLCNRTMMEVQLRERYGIDVVGAWSNGHFVSPVPPDMPLRAGVHLLVAGRADRIPALRQEASSIVRRVSHCAVVVAGYGRAGEAAAAALARTNSRVTVLDCEAKEAVDVVGDVRDPSALREAGIEQAEAVIITVDDDTTAIFAALVLRELNPELHIIVRANKVEDEQKLYRAGADYVQSLATVSGRMLASTIFEDEEVLSVEKRVEVVKLPAGRLVGQTLVEADVRAHTGCTVLAVERGGATIADLDPHTFRFAEDDEVVVAGTGESVRHFETQFL